MSARLNFEASPATATAFLPRYRDLPQRPAPDRATPAKPADPIGLFTRDELRAMVMELMG